MEKTPYDRYASKEWKWEQVVDEYEGLLDQLDIPRNIDHNEIMKLDKKIDEMYRFFRKDYAKVKERYSRVERALKRAEREGAALPSKDGTKMNDTYRKAKAVQYASNFPMDGTTVNLYDLENMLSAQVEYFDYINDVLEEKNRVMIRALGCLKIDVTLN